MASAPKDIYFQEQSPLDVSIRTTKSYWQFIVLIKHPSIARHEKQVRLAIADPDEIRQSKNNAEVYLYYRRIGKLYVCVVVAHQGYEGFVITAYLTDRVKEGIRIWKKHL